MEEGGVLLDILFQKLPLPAHQLFHPAGHFRGKPLPAHPDVQVGLAYDHLEMNQIILAECLPVGTVLILQFKT